MSQPDLLDAAFNKQGNWQKKKLKNPKATVRLGTLFSGIGAVEHALKRLKLKTEIVFAGDIDPFVKEAYYANYNIDDSRWHDDITKFSAKKYKYFGFAFIYHSYKVIK